VTGPTSSTGRAGSTFGTGGRSGVANALIAYVLWGTFPLYFSLLAPAGALEIVAERIVFCFAFLMIVLLLRRDWAWLGPILRDRRRLVMLVASAAVISANWLTYNWAVNTNQAVEGSLGYFISPLVTVLIGVVALRERLRRAQWVAVAIAFVAVLVMSTEEGRVPWIALVLAATFAVYGWIMKFVETPPVEALTIGMGAMFVPFLAVLVVLQVQGELTLGSSDPGKDALLVGAGVVTAVPMIFFGAAAAVVPLSTMGVLQYVNPVLQFVFSVAVLGEALSAGRWIGFVLVWAALVVFAVDGVRTSRRAARAAADTAPLARP
jgi:chloramphenicol-sensitive protein RarD